MSGIEANAGAMAHGWVVHEPVVERGVFDDQHFRARDRHIADRVSTWRLGDLDAAPGLEPLAITVNETDGSGGGSEHPLRQRRDTVKAILRLRVDDIQAVESFLAMCLVDTVQHQQTGSAVVREHRDERRGEALRDGSVGLRGAVLLDVIRAYIGEGNGGRGRLQGTHTVNLGIEFPGVEVGHPSR